MRVGRGAVGMGFLENVLGRVQKCSQNIPIKPTLLMVIYNKCLRIKNVPDRSLKPLQKWLTPK